MDEFELISIGFYIKLDFSGLKVCSRVTSSRNYAAKDINFGDGARAAMLRGVSEVAEAVKVTMGPKVSDLIGRFDIGGFSATSSIAGNVKICNGGKNCLQFSFRCLHIPRWLFELEGDCN